MWKKLMIALSVIAMVATLGLIQGCSESDKVVEPLITDIDQPKVDRDCELELTDLKQFDVNDRHEALNGGKNEQSTRSSSSWWSNLSQSQRNYRIILEALYSVDRNIWGQNSRISNWSCYLNGGCPLMGNWAYSYRYPGRVGYGGWCKPFVNELLRRASGWATSLPSGYDYIGTFPYRNKRDAIRYAQPGEVLQFTGAGTHTCVIISNLHDGRFEVVDANWSSPYDYRIRKHVINTYKSGSKWTSATLRSYVINH